MSIEAVVSATGGITMDPVGVAVSVPIVFLRAGNFAFACYACVRYGNRSHVTG